MTNNSDKPTPPALNLDTLEREGAPDEFPVILGGKRIVLSDAQEIDWQTLMLAMSGNPRDFFRLIVPEKHQEVFFGADMPAWKLRALMDAYTEHYGLTDPGNPLASSR